MQVCFLKGCSCHSIQFSKHLRCFAFENSGVCVCVFSAICESQSKHNYGVAQEWKSMGRSRINCTTRIKSKINEMPLQCFQFVGIVFLTTHLSRLLSLSNMSDHRICSNTAAATTAASTTTAAAKQAVYRTRQCRTEWWLQHHWRRPRSVCVSGIITQQNPAF